MKAEDFSLFPCEECRPAEKVMTKCEDCILKWEDPKINSGFLDPHLVKLSPAFSVCALGSAIPGLQSSHWLGVDDWSCIPPCWQFSSTSRHWEPVDSNHWAQCHLWIQYLMLSCQLWALFNNFRLICWTRSCRLVSPIISSFTGKIVPYFITSFWIMKTSKNKFDWEFYWNVHDMIMCFSLQRPPWNSMMCYLPSDLCQQPKEPRQRLVNHRSGDRRSLRLQRNEQIEREREKVKVR